MVELTWANSALDDLESIFTFIARDSLNFAKKFVKRIFDISDVLIASPMSGRIIPELNDASLREMIFGNYRIMYCYRENEIVIIAIHHSARLLDTESASVLAEYSEI